MNQWCKKILSVYISKLIYSDSRKISIDDQSSHISDFKSIKVFNSCLILIMLDVIYFFLYVLPLSLGISIYNYNNSFVHLLMIIIIAYQSDNGALLAGNKFGKNQFGHPITPSKTIEGIYGAYALGYHIFKINFIGFFLHYFIGTFWLMCSTLKLWDYLNS